MLTSPLAVASEDPYAGTVVNPGEEPAYRATPVHMGQTRSSTGDPLVWRQQPVVLYGTEPGVVEFVLDLQPGFTVYREHLEVEVVSNRSALTVGPADLPPGIVKQVEGRDETAREQYDDDIVVRLPVQAQAGTVGLQTLFVRMQHQSCISGHCYRPQEYIMAVHVPVREAPIAPEPPPVKVDREGTPTPK
ncbi:MAG: protein-disulfide reductase DsbD domain-containing protein [Myxococcota bacterium]